MLVRTSEAYASSGPSQAYSETSVNAWHTSVAKPILTGPRAQKWVRVAQALVSLQEVLHGGAGLLHRNHAALPVKPWQGSSVVKMEDKAVWNKDGGVVAWAGDASGG